MLTTRNNKQRSDTHPLRCAMLAGIVMLGNGCTTKPLPSYYSEVQALPIGEYVLSPSLSYLTLSAPVAENNNTLLSFDRFAATLDFNEKFPERTRLEAIIHLQSASANDPSDSALLSEARLFNSRQFPVGRFTSTNVDMVSKDTMQISGELNLRGVLHPIVLKSRFIGAAINPITGERTLAFNASAKVSAEELGLGKIAGFEELELQLYGEFLRNTRVRIN